MRVRDLRITLEGLRSIFTAVGAPAQEKALGKVASSLEAHDDAPLETYLGEIEHRVGEAVASLTEKFIRRLNAAELDEAKFLAALGELQQSKKLKKTDAQKIAQAYTGSYDRRASVEKLIDHIKRAFYTKVYERDSQAIAGRAKPI